MPSQIVSTLIRPSGRMQRSEDVERSTEPGLFQPSSDLQAGCNVRNVTISYCRSSVFQPSSDLQAGCNAV